MTAARSSLFLCLLVLSITPQIHAQEREYRFEASAGYSLLRGEFLAAASSHHGVLGRLGYPLRDSLSFEGEFSFFPQDLGVASKGITAGFFGAKYGHRFQRVGVFGKVRPGFAHFQEPETPILCVAIVPPPQTCVIGGRTEFALDAGAVFEVYARRRLTFRVDAGDAMIRFRDAGGSWNHNFMFTSSVGFRF